MHTRKNQESLAKKITDGYTICHCTISCIATWL
jgi:hypothetical protein